MSEVEYTELYLGKFLIQEPVTSITDVITAMVCILSFISLSKLKVLDRSFLFMKYYFLFIGLGTLFAAFFSHAIVYITGHNYRLIGWSLSAVGIFCIENASLLFYQKEKKSKPLNILRYIFAAKLLFFFIILTIPEFRVFRVVQINALIGIALIAIPLFFILQKYYKRPGYTYVFYALLATLIPGFIFNYELSFHKYFNYHDLSHVMMSIVIFLLYQGVRQIAIDLKLLKSN